MPGLRLTSRTAPAPAAPPQLRYRCGCCGREIPAPTPHARHRCPHCGRGLHSPREMIARCSDCGATAIVAFGQRTDALVCADCGRPLTPHEAVLQPRHRHAPAGGRQTAGYSDAAWTVLVVGAVLFGLVLLTTWF